MTRHAKKNGKKIRVQGNPWANTNCRDGNLRLLIAWRIRQQRELKFPGRGGGGRCAKAYKVSGQQWSSWETGFRTPDDERLADMAKFFGVQLELFKTEPENWPELRKELSAAMQRRRRGKYVESPEPEALPEPPPEASDVSSDTHHRESIADVSLSKTGGETETWFDVFDLLVEARKKHAKGEIPDDRYREGMKAVKTIVKITFGENM